MKKRFIYIYFLSAALAAGGIFSLQLEAAPEGGDGSYRITGIPNDPYAHGGKFDPFYTEYEASSYLIEKGQPKDMFAPRMASWNDTPSRRAWCEGVKGPGIGEWIKITYLDSKVDNNGQMGNPWDMQWIPRSSVAYRKHIHELYRIVIFNGFAKTKELYYANNRVKTLGVEFSDGTKMTLHLKDGLDWSRGYPAPQLFYLNRIQAKWVKFTILAVYLGKKYDDTCISQLMVEYDDEGIYLPENVDHYMLIDTRDKFIKMLTERYGNPTESQLKFIKLNVNRNTGSTFTGKIRDEEFERKEKFKSTAEVLHRMCEMMNVDRDPPCVHPELIDGGK